MADQEEQVSSTTYHEELNHHLDGMGDFNEATPKGIIEVDDEIVDLVGGAQDAIDRHKAEDNVPSSEVLSTLTESEPVPAMEPELLPMPTVTEPEAEPESIPFATEPEQAPPTSEDATETPLTEEEDPDSAVPETVEAKEEPVFVPQPEPESTQVAAEAEVVHQPEPIPEPHISAPVEPPTAAPEEVVHPIEAPAKEAPASYAPSPPKAQLHHLMQFPTVVDLLYWRDVKTTGVVFGAALLLLLSLTVCSIVSVCSYVGLALLSVTIAFRIYKGILQAIQKSDEGHPFKLFLDKDVALSEDTVHKYSDVALARINKTIGDLRRLFLVEDLVDSIKFAVFMWILTYVGALFNGLTILILGLVAAFSCPIIYEKHQAQIDHYVGMVNNQIKDIVAKIQAKVPGMKRKAE